MANRKFLHNVNIHRDFEVIERGWYSARRAMRFADVLDVGDPVISAFEMVFYHQKSRLTRSVNIFMLVNSAFNNLSVAP